MLIRTRRSWELPESAATPENVWMNRRAWLKGAGFAGLWLATSGLVPTAAMAAIGGYPYPRNEAYQLDRALTDEEMATTYTNFYEFGSSKNIWKKTRKMVTDPWAVTIDGMVEAEVTMDAEQLVSAMGGFEERLYRPPLRRGVGDGGSLVRRAAGEYPEGGEAAVGREICAVRDLHGSGRGAGPETGLVPVALCRGADHRGGAERAVLPRHRESMASRCRTRTARRSGLSRRGNTASSRSSRSAGSPSPTSGRSASGRSWRAMNTASGRM